MTNWIMLSILMFFSSIALYLTIRKSSLLNISTQLITSSIFIFPFFICLSLGLITRQNFLLSFQQYLLIAAAAIFFSYLGNLLLVRGIAEAPNPGYPLVISKSYVTFTTIASIFIFGSEFSIRKGLGIVLIILFLSFVLVDSKKTIAKKNKKWILLSFGSFFCTSFLILTSKFLFLQNISSQIFLTYIFLVGSICNIIEILRKKERIKFETMKNNDWVIVVVIGILSALFNLFLYSAMQVAPNIGYVNAINASSISFVTIFSVFLYKDEFRARKLFGVIGVIAGLIVLLV